MAQITLKGNPIETLGMLPAVGEKAPVFQLVKTDLSEVNLQQYQEKKVVLNIFPSIDTATCALSVKTFNQKAAAMNNTVVLCVSADLPFALKRFCGAEGIESVEAVSTFRSSFGRDYQVAFKTGPLQGLLSRSVVIICEEGKVAYTEQVQETADEPDYEAALNAL